MQLAYHIFLRQAFSPQSPSTDYTINVIFSRCRSVEGTNSTPRVCDTDIAALSPTTPGVCTMFDPLPGVSGDITNATILANRAAAGVGAAPSTSPSPPSTTLCGALSTLEGDFAAFTDPPSFASQYLLAPLQCDDFSVCGNRTTETTDRWLVVDSSGRVEAVSHCIDILIVV